MPGIIDIAIPAICGLLMVTGASQLVKDDKVHYQQKRKMLRMAGIVLLGVAVFYAVMFLNSA